MDNNTMLNSALKYRESNFWPIPIRTDVSKKPHIKWKKYQSEPPNESDISDWWNKWPDADIGLITGQHSNLTIVDIDSEDAKKVVDEYIPDSYAMPVAKTKKGWHYYFRYADGLPNTSGILEKVDVRSDGGYIIAPPSKDKIWISKVSEVGINEIPSSLYNILLSSIYTRGGVHTDVHMVSTDVHLFSKGRRDDDLFRLANHLVKSGLDNATIYRYLYFCASRCDPPYPKSEIASKINSAISRQDRIEKSIAEEVREFVLSTNGHFLSTDVRICLQLSTRKENKNLSMALSRLVEEGVIERCGNRNGQFRRICSEINTLDPFSAPETPLDIKFPLNIHSMFETLPKNIIIIAGTQDSGKTAFMLRTALMNMNHGFKVRYMSSEMSGQELRKRLQAFEDVGFDEWKAVEWLDCSSGFVDKILPDDINIIDYFEISDNFYQIGNDLKQIYEKLEGGVAIIALQKDFKSDFGRGGTFSLEKPRLYVTLTSNPPDGGIAKIVKCKNWKLQDFNPNNRVCNFKIRRGNEIRQLTEWDLPGKVIKDDRSRKDLY